VPAVEFRVISPILTQIALYPIDAVPNASDELNVAGQSGNN